MECLAKEEQEHSLSNAHDDAKPFVAQSLGFGNAPDNCSWVAEFRNRDLVCAAQKTSSTFKLADGTNTNIDWQFKDEYRDEYTTEPLPSGEIRAAIADEMTYFNDHVWLGVHSPDAHADSEGKILNGRWVFCNKGDAEHPDCRARYAACEINT